MPDISTLLEKESKKKFKKSEYRPWNYLDEIEKEKGEKIEELSTNKGLDNSQRDQNLPEKEALTVIRAPVSIHEKIDQDKLITIPQVENLPSINEVKKEQPNSPLYSILRLSGHQKAIFSFILERCLSRGLLSSGIVTSQTLISITQTTLSMVNTSIQRLVDKQLIFRENGKRGRGGFYCFGISELVKDAATEYKRLSAFDDIDGPIKNADEKQLESYETQTAIGSHTTQIPKELAGIDISSLSKIGFKNGHLIQLFKQGNIDFNTIQDSINHFAFDLQYNNKAAEIKKSTPIGFFMGILNRTGLYNPPVNYESPKDIALRILLESKKAAKEKRDSMLKELINIAFEEWQSKLTNEEKDKIIPVDIRRGRLSGAKEASLKLYFTENVWPGIAPKEVDFQGS